MSPLMGQGPANSLGRAVEAAHETAVALQSFGPYVRNLGICHSGDSLMLWRGDSRLIYFLLVDNGGLHWDECPDSWQVFPDTWQPGEPNNEDILAPEGRVVPRSGFGKIWRTRLRTEAPGLGFPSMPESYTTATVQRFEGGTAFYFHDSGRIFVLFDSFHYLTRGGPATGPVWFLVQSGKDEG